MKTSLEVMNMNATYEVRSQHIVDFQRNAIAIRRSILSITHTVNFLVEFSLKFIITHSKKKLNKSSSASREM